MRKLLLAMAVLGVLGTVTNSAKADRWGRHHRVHRHVPRTSFYIGWGSPSVPIYHAPSVHYDAVYHAEYLHWTPLRGLHTHGHYDLVPHYTPGHFDYLHGGHIDVNPWFHH